MTLTIEYDQYGLAGIWSDTDCDLYEELVYASGHEPPRYPMPAILSDVTFETKWNNHWGVSRTELIIWKWSAHKLGIRVISAWFGLK